MLDTSIFRRIIATKQDIQTSPDNTFTYIIYHSWVKRLGEALNYFQTLITYCLRRALKNTINNIIFLFISLVNIRYIDKLSSSNNSNSNTAVRNLALDYIGSMMFKRNYISKIIRYNTQNVF
jgi:hypothetical protein